MENKQGEYIHLLESCKQGLISYIRHSLWDKERIEDALQNTLLEGWKKFGVFSGSETAFRAWMFQIATYTVFNMNRAGAKEKQRFTAINEEIISPEQGSDLINQPPARPNDFGRSGGDYEKFLENSGRIFEEMPDKIKGSIEALSENERSVFLLRSLGGLSYDEISQALSIPAGSVMGYLARARLKLREQLYEYAKEHKYV